SRCSAQNGQRRAKGFGEGRTHDDILRREAMPRERSATAGPERRRDRRLAPEHAKGLCVIDHEPPTSIRRKTRECRQRCWPAARWTEAIGDDQRTLACATRLSHAPFERNDIAVRKGFDGDAFDRGALCRPARDRVGGGVE